MAVKIDKKITGFAIVKEDEKLTKVALEKKEKGHEQMSERIKRPESLAGETYKIKPPHAEHALYVTINDIILNEGTEHEVRRPFEIFLSSKNMEHFQWTIALTLIISAVFRKGGDITFLVEELRSVFDPNGGYFKRGSKYVPSLVSEIGDVIEKHLRKIGMLPEEDVDENQRLFIAGKKAELNQKQQPSNDDEVSFPPESQLCHKCNTKAMVQMDGCMTCLSCGYSKCG
ncbi:TSCPD domain-containing protein [Facilibium subflavum]|uniref:TSCPD domain-containing protein n=1 Tax=Facilibium subflavum TaxID=2219058 RepID=UPI000E649C2A|nr:NrdJb [Facilibium subflavum]